MYRCIHCLYYSCNLCPSFCLTFVLRKTCVIFILIRRFLRCDLVSPAVSWLDLHTVYFCLQFSFDVRRSNSFLVFSISWWLGGYFFHNKTKGKQISRVYVQRFFRLIHRHNVQIELLFHTVDAEANLVFIFHLIWQFYTWLFDCIVHRVFLKFIQSLGFDSVFLKLW